MKDHDNQQISKFLLGELSEEDRHRLETQLFTDDEFFEQMLAAEDDLIDSYASGELSAAEGERFEKRLFLTPQQRQRVAFAEALKIKAAEEARKKALAGPTPAPSWWQSFLALLGWQNFSTQFAFAVAAVVLTLGCGWLIFETLRLRNQVAQLQTAQVQQQKEASHQQRELAQQAEEERARNERLTAELERERQQREQLEQEMAKPQRPAAAEETPTFAAFLLTPGILRDERGAKRLSLAPQVKHLRLQLDVRRIGNYQTYRAELKTVEGGEIFHQDGLKAKPTGSGRKAIIWNLPARIFNDGDYKIVLTGLNTDGSFDDLDTYYFSVLKGK
jgi:hypothetical protein